MRTKAALLILACSTFWLLAAYGAWHAVTACPCVCILEE
jgi:hypothetical protein